MNDNRGGSIRRAITRRRSINKLDRKAPHSTDIRFRDVVYFEPPGSSGTHPVQFGQSPHVYRIECRFEIVRSEDVNAYDILKNKTLLLTKASFDKLVKRIES